MLDSSGPGEDRRPTTEGDPKTMKLVLDCDPGVDDAVAVMLALASPEVELLGLSTVFGNAPVDVTTRNARTLLRAGGRPDLPVAKGAHGPLVGRFGGGVPFIHGKDGLGDGNVARASEDDRPPDLSAVELLRREVLAAPGEVTLLAVGPLTNIALFARVHPEAARQVARVVVMGGNALSPGNITPGAEANIHNDPEAADIVMGFDWPVAMVGLDVTDGIVLGPAHLDAIGSGGTPAHDLLARAVPLYRQFYKDFNDIDGVAAHDPAALALLLVPDLFDTEDWPIRVELSGIGRGKTWPQTRRRPTPPPGWEGRPPVQVATGARSEAVADFIADRIAKARFGT
ncbi:nucleoside hydrolase [Rubellimicrobium roseum]|uniref:Nucleoside hydrolase n=1 Tax=Rubellimicrobium roseum TaxID=687525 RepID=A0A5C4NDI1_9RHOB|nr:nucleoside hydrolase [Rubellimicrobium roseum]TNC71975.1 nucleoside hydrolase [Rubellimicrobium roseum]